jgi:hypothetical protein
MAGAIGAVANVVGDVGVVASIVMRSREAHLGPKAFSAIPPAIRSFELARRAIVRRAATAFPAPFVVPV